MTQPQKRQCLLGVVAAVFPAVAALIILIGWPSPVEAFGCDCSYGGTYSHGACIEAARDPEETQQCNGGQWDGCAPECPTLPPCIP